jgi:hypothetical protein
MDARLPTGYTCILHLASSLHCALQSLFSLIVSANSSLASCRSWHWTVPNIVAVYLVVGRQT